MTNMQEGYVKRASLKESLIKAINESGLSAYEIQTIIEGIYNEVARLARQEEEQSIAVYKQENTSIDEEPTIKEEHIIYEEPRIIGSGIIQHVDQDRMCKRNYPQVGEQTLREESEDTPARESNGVGVKTFFAGAMALLMAVSTGVVMLALAGAAVLFMPMLGGMANE